jgi:hypothetical protein
LGSQAQFLCEKRRMMHICEKTGPPCLTQPSPILGRGWHDNQLETLGHSRDKNIHTTIHWPEVIIDTETVNVSSWLQGQHWYKQLPSQRVL